MLSFSLYFDQYFHLFRTIQKFNVMVFMQVGCLRAMPEFKKWTDIIDIQAAF